MNPLAVYSGGPSVLVTGWVAFIVIIGGVAAAGLTVWKVLWPLLHTTVKLVDQLPFFTQAQERHEALAAQVDDHEDRITVLEQNRH